MRDALTSHHQDLGQLFRVDCMNVPAQVNYWLTASPNAYLLGTFAGIGAVVDLKVEDYYPSGKRLI